MAISSLNQTSNLGMEYSPTYTKPQYSAGDKIAAVFGNDTGMKNKEAQAAVQNQYEYNKAYQLNKHLWNVQGLKNAGINPMISYSQSSDGGANSYSSSSVKPDKATRSTVGDMLSGIFKAFTNILGALGEIIPF